MKTLTKPARSASKQATAHSVDEALKPYKNKRNFTITAEPSGDASHAGAKPAKAGSGLSFVIQKHWASSLHYDFRLELGGTMKSWAVPKGPSLDTKDKRLAVQAEDHPISYSSFEGYIPAGQYGAGRVIIWDKGTWTPTVDDPQKAYLAGNLKFTLHGHKLAGNWALVRMAQDRTGGKQPPWLLIKEKDDFARPSKEFIVVEALPDSVADMKNGTRAVPKETAVAKAIDVSAPPAVAKARKARASGKAVSNRGGEVHITHAERVIDTQSGLTKGDLVEYYRQVADLLMVHLQERPTAVMRAPDGVGSELFFQKHLGAAAWSGIEAMPADRAASPNAMLHIRGAQGVLSAAQWNVVEFHTANASKRALLLPDRMVFDLDPGEGVQWVQIREAAALVCAFLSQLELRSFVKTSGGKGLHVVVPLRRTYDWATVKDVSHAIVQHVSAQIPQRFVAKSGPSNRVGKIFIDYLRNGEGATTVSAWSARARAGMGISVPVAWDELDTLRSGDHWTVNNFAERLSVGNSPWDGYAKAARSLTTAMRKLGYKPAN